MTMPSPGEKAKGKALELMNIVGDMDSTIKMQDAAAQKGQMEILRLGVTIKRLRAKLKKVQRK